MICCRAPPKKKKKKKRERAAESCIPACGRGPGLAIRGGLHLAIVPRATGPLPRRVRVGPGNSLAGRLEVKQRLSRCCRARRREAVGNADSELCPLFTSDTAE